MTDIIWGNGQKIISTDSFQINVTHRKDGNSDEYPDSEFPVVEDGKYKGMIGVGGLVLARVPEEIAQQRNEYYAKQHSDKVEAMDNDLMKEQHPSMPIDIDRQSRVTFGGSKKS